MSTEELIAHLEQYEAELSGILSRFSNSNHINQDDDPKYRQIVQELVDLLNDNLGRNQSSTSIATIANNGVSNFTQSPSFKSVEDIISVLRSVITRIKRNPSVVTSNPERPKNQIDQVWALLHPSVVALAKPRFEAGHYADAVEAVLKELNSVVKLIHKKSANEELDGAALMRKAFTPNKPTIVLDDLKTETGRNIQQGHMDLFAGTMIGIRNPKAHGNVVITPEQAIHHFFLASLLFHKLDERRCPPR
jgi:uncharacterized protein (TIGR02391 family)